MGWIKMTNHTFSMHWSYRRSCNSVDKTMGVDVIATSHTTSHTMSAFSMAVLSWGGSFYASLFVFFTSLYFFSTNSRTMHSDSSNLKSYFHLDWKFYTLKRCLIANFLHWCPLTSKLTKDSDLEHMPFCWFCHEGTHFVLHYLCSLLVSIFFSTQVAASWQNQQNGICTQRRLRSESSLSAWRKLGSLATQWAHNKDWADAQADLSLHWAHMPRCWFCWLYKFEKTTGLLSSFQWYIILPKSNCDEFSIFKMI